MNAAGKYPDAIFENLADPMASSGEVQWRFDLDQVDDWVDERRFMPPSSGRQSDTGEAIALSESGATASPLRQLKRVVVLAGHNELTINERTVTVARRRHAEDATCVELWGEGFPHLSQPRYLVLGAAGKTNGYVHATQVHLEYGRMIATNLIKPTTAAKFSYSGPGHDVLSTVYVDMSVISPDYVALKLINKHDEFEFAAVPVPNMREPWLWAKTAESLEKLMIPESPERKKFNENQRKRHSMLSSEESATVVFGDSPDATPSSST